MKKKIVVLALICVLAIFCVAFSIYAESQLRLLTVNVAHEGNVSVYVDGKYISDAPLSRYVSKNSTVRLVSNDDNFMFYSNPEGNTFGYEGEYSFQMMAKTTVDVWFENTNAEKVTVIYKNTNSTQQILAASTYFVIEVFFFIWYNQFEEQRKERRPPSAAVNGSSPMNFQRRNCDENEDHDLQHPL